MKRFSLGKISALLALLALIGLFMLYTPARAQDTPADSPSPYDVEAIYRAAYAALNAGDLEDYLQYYTDDAIVIALPAPPGLDPMTVGKDALSDWTVIFLESHPHIEFTDLHIHGDTLTVRTVATDDFLASSGVGYLRFSGTAIVRDGLIVSETFYMDQESLDRLIAADTLQTNKAIVGRIYDEFFNQGEMSGVEEIIDPAVTVSFTHNTGIEAFVNDINFFRTVYPDIKIEYSDAVAEGDIVVVNIAGSGTYQGGLEDLGVPASAIGKKVTWTGTDYTRIVNGKVVEVWGNHDDLPWILQHNLKLMADE